MIICRSDGRWTAEPAGVNESSWPAQQRDGPPRSVPLHQMAGLTLVYENKQARDSTDEEETGTFSWSFRGVKGFLRGVEFFLQVHL